MQAMERQALYAADPVSAQIPAAQTQGQRNRSEYAICRHTHKDTGLHFSEFINYFNACFKSDSKKIADVSVIPIAMCKCFFLKEKKTPYDL